MGPALRSGAAAAVAAAITLAALAGCSAPRASVIPIPAPAGVPTAATVPTPTGAPTSATAPGPRSVPSPPGRPQATALGPNGYGGLKLGMTGRQALATGELVECAGAAESSCLSLRDAGPEEGAVCVSDQLGVAAIFAFPGVRTPEGVGMGSTMAATKAAYSGLRTGVNGFTVPVPQNPEAFYSLLFDEQGQVYEMALALNRQDCFG